MISYVELIDRNLQWLNTRTGTEPLANARSRRSSKLKRTNNKNSVFANKYMRLISWMIIATIAIVLFCIWTSWMLFPEQAKIFYSVESTGTKGINSLKSDFGGAVLAVSVFIGLFLFRKDNYWAVSAIVILFTIALSRSISLIFDGYTSFGLNALIIEILTISALYHLLRANKDD